MTKVTINKKWINASSTQFKEELTNGERKYYLEALVVPFSAVSRNGVLYSRESIEKTYKNVIDKHLHHNHEIEGSNNYPKGKWVESWLEDDGLHAKAIVYNTEYNKDYIEWLKADGNPQVSLQISGDAESVKGEDGKYFQRAEIRDWLEISSVNVPGFLQAKGSFEAVMTEMLKQEDNDMTNSQDVVGVKMVKDTKEETVFKIGDAVASKNGRGVISDIKGNKISIKTDDTEIEEDVYNVWKIETEFFKTLDTIREKYTN